MLEHRLLGHRQTLQQTRITEHMYVVNLICHRQTSLHECLCWTVEVNYVAFKY